MNVNNIKDDIKSMLNKEVTIKVLGSRNKTQIYRGLIDKCYSNIFTVLTEGSYKTFTYSDVAIGDVVIYDV